VSLYLPLPRATPAGCIIRGRAERGMTQGAAFVTVARLSRTENSSLNVGDIVDRAITDWTMPMMTIPTMGAPIEFTFEKKAGNTRSSAAGLAVWESVNCQPGSEPTQGRTASGITMG